MISPRDLPEGHGDEWGKAFLEGLSAGLGDGRVRLRKVSALESPRPGYADGYDTGQKRALAERVSIDRAEREAVRLELIRRAETEKRLAKGGIGR